MKAKTLLLRDISSPWTFLFYLFIYLSIYLFIYCCLALIFLIGLQINRFLYRKSTNLNISTNLNTSTNLNISISKIIISVVFEQTIQNCLSQYVPNQLVFTEKGKKSYVTPRYFWNLYSLLLDTNLGRIKSKKINPPPPQKKPLLSHSLVAIFAQQAKSCTFTYPTPLPSSQSLSIN